jgi:TolB protein
MKHMLKLIYRGLRFALLLSLYTFGWFSFLKTGSASAQADPGSIAYVNLSTYDIHLISPDGTGDRVLWTAPQPLPAWPAFDLAWRPDGTELAFSSEHEEICSWYQSDIFAIRPDGAGYRRITNAPACAVLASLPKGSVTVNVSYWTGDMVQVYVAGAPEPKTVLSDATVTFNNVADFGPGVAQPAIGIWGLYRIFASQPLADVQPGATVPGGNLIIAPYSGIQFFGTGKISWNASGSALAYGMRTYSSINQIPAVPSYGSIGTQLPVVANASPGLVAWGPTAASRDQYLYFTMDDPVAENVGGIYLNTVGDASGGEKLVPFNFYDAEQVYDIEWLPDASGFLFSKFYVDFGYYSDLFEYDFATRQVTQLTSHDHAHAFSISPDGQSVVFERLVDDYDDSTSSLWIMNRDGSDLHKLADDAGRPAWGVKASSLPPAPDPIPAHAHKIFLPLAKRD